MYNFGSFDAFIVKPTIMPDFARNLLHYIKCNHKNSTKEVLGNIIQNSYVMIAALWVLFFSFFFKFLLFRQT